MNYLLDYKIFEYSQEERGSWQKNKDGSLSYIQKNPWDNTENMIQDIKDMLLPLSDMGYKPYIQDNTVNWGPFFKEPTELIIRIVTYTDRILKITDDVKDELDRLNEYLESKGYSINAYYVRETGTGQSKKTYNDFINSVDFVRNLLFVAKKENISEAIDSNIIGDIDDILMELNDGDRIKAGINITTGKNKSYILFTLKDHLNYDGFYFNEISEYIFRIKDYLGDNLNYCDVLLVRDKNRYGVGGSRIKIDLNNEKSITKKLENLPIENLAIRLK